MVYAGLVYFLVGTSFTYLGLGLSMARADRKSAQRLARGDLPRRRDYILDYWALFSLIKRRGSRGYVEIYLLLLCILYAVSLGVGAMSAAASLTPPAFSLANQEILLLVLIPLWPIVPIFLIRLGFGRTSHLAAMV